MTLKVTECSNNFVWILNGDFLCRSLIEKKMREEKRVSDRGKSNSKTQTEGIELFWLNAFFRLLNLGGQR